MTSRIKVKFLVNFSRANLKPTQIQLFEILPIDIGIRKNIHSNFSLSLNKKWPLWVFSIRPYEEDFFPNYLCK